MSNLIKDLIACGNKHCDHIATNEEISKLQQEYFKSLLTDCIPIKNKKEKKKCINKKTKKSKHLKLNKKRSKCIDKNCNQKKQILNRPYLHRQSLRRLMMVRELMIFIHVY